jgi:hypothetical protein
VVDEIVELERVDLAGVVAGEPVSDAPDQLGELRLVVGSDGRARRAPFSL